MTPTSEQTNCIETASHNRVTIIQAVAGAGKTSTLKLISETLSVPSLYLAFNKSAAAEATNKFPLHVKCRTTHSMAYAAFGKNLAHKLARPKGAYANVAGTGGEIARFYKISPVYAFGSVIVSAAYMGLMVSRTVAKFEQSGDDEIVKLHLPYFDLLEIAEKHKIKTDQIGDQILTISKRLWKDRINLDSIVLATHDTYLKLWQLSKPQLDYDVLYIDEAQDSSGCVLALIKDQKTAKIVLVGDSRQAIYGWRGSIDAMNLMEEGVQCTLSKSFRYGHKIAAIATSILDNVINIEGSESIPSVVGYSHVVDRNSIYTVLCRTNAYLLDSAIADLRLNKRVSIEIDVKDFVRMLDSAQALYINTPKDVKHERILPFNNWEELKEEGKHGGELRTFANIIENDRVDEIRNILSTYTKPEHPEIIYTTSHKSKGLEYDQVLLGNDFPSNYNTAGEWIGLMATEQNLLYVAATRAIHKLEYNSTVLEILEKK